VAPYHMEMTQTDFPCDVVTYCTIPPWDLKRLRSASGDYGSRDAAGAICGIAARIVEVVDSFISMHRCSAHPLAQREAEAELLLHGLLGGGVHDIYAPPQRPSRPLARVLVLQRQPLLCIAGGRMKLCVLAADLDCR